MSELIPHRPLEVVGKARRRVDARGKVTGQTVYTDDILDRIFSRFCIGK